MRELAINIDQCEFLNKILHVSLQTPNASDTILVE